MMMVNVQILLMNYLLNFDRLENYYLHDDVRMVFQVLLMDDHQLYLFRMLLKNDVIHYVLVFHQLVVIQLEEFRLHRFHVEL